MSQTNTTTTSLKAPASYEDIRAASEQHYFNSLQTTDMRGEGSATHTVVDLINTAITKREPKGLQDAIRFLNENLDVAKRYRGGAIDPDVAKAKTLLEQYMLLGRPIHYVPNTLAKRPAALHLVEGGRIA